MEASPEEFENELGDLGALRDAVLDDEPADEDEDAHEDGDGDGDGDGDADGDGANEEPQEPPPKIKKKRRPHPKSFVSHVEAKLRRSFVSLEGSSEKRLAVCPQNWTSASNLNVGSYGMKSRADALNATGFVKK